LQLKKAALIIILKDGNGKVKYIEVMGRDRKKEYLMICAKFMEYKMPEGKKKQKNIFRKDRQKQDDGTRYMGTESEHSIL
jgi:hypothetical protein